jgi:lipopolysaccharide export system ATP-binding protein
MNAFSQTGASVALTSVESVEEFTLLVANQLEKQLGDAPIVNRVSLYVRRGEIIALLGPSGAGKTTLFHLLAGLMVPDRGTIVLDRVDITMAPLHERARRGIGYLPQESSVFRGLNVVQNITLALEARPMSAERRSAMLEKLLLDLELVEVRRTSAGRLSGGQRRRCEIAQALAGSPTILLLDEPFAGVDPLAIQDIRNILRYLSRQGLGVIISDHNVREALNIVDYAYVMNAGSIIMQGSPAEVFASSDVKRLYLGEGFRS